MSGRSTPASQLVGRTLKNGWIATERLALKSASDSFSEAYMAQHTSGKVAYLKALDFSSAIESEDPARALEHLTAAFNYERQILEKCRDERLDRVVIAIDDGIVRIADGPGQGTVQYLIFEMPRGDARSHAEFAQGFDVAWALRSLHNTAVGLGQLHTQGVAHQDLKPSAIWVFDGQEQGISSTKVAELGRSASKAQSAPHEDVLCSGDPAYAPPELLYGYTPAEWNTRRFGCDSYLLGSMVVFFFMGVPLTPLLKEELDRSHLWTEWSGSFQDVLPYLRDAFDRLMIKFKEILPPELREDIMPLVRQLCDPDPDKRGDMALKARKANQFAMERYISHFDRLAKASELRLKKRLR